MDSLTQVALGAAVGEATLGRKVGYRAMMWGAICGTLPDLDVFIPLGDAVRDFTYHRSASHSLIVLAALTPIVVWLILKLHPQTREHRGRWGLLVYLVFATHVLLDSFTVYGTQILWPVNTTPMTWSSIFIIDPLYTLPLLVGVSAALVMSRTQLKGHRWNTVGLVLSSGYLLWSVGAKLYVEGITREALSNGNIAYDRFMTMATPFNTLLWRVLVVNENDYYLGYYSLREDDRTIRFQHYPRNNQLLTGIEEHWPVQRLRWFTKGFYSVTTNGQDIVINDLRMGLEPDFVFRFKVGELSNPHTNAAPPERVPTQLDWSRLRVVWQRVISP